jgi:hypothetical protein
LLRVPDLQDPELREDLARASYYRERFEDMTLDQEHCTDETARYFCLRWEQLSQLAQRPYRIAVAQTLDHVAEFVSV